MDPLTCMIGVFIRNAACLANSELFCPISEGVMVNYTDKPELRLDEGATCNGVDIHA